MSNDLALKLIMNADDGISNVIKRAVNTADSEFGNLQNKLNQTASKFDSFGKKAMLTGGVITAFSGVNVKVAADFQSEMTNVETLIDSSKENIKDMGNEVLGVSRRTPVALKDLTGALYNVRSAGIDASNQFKVLEKSAQLGVAGLGSTNESVDLVTSSLNSFQLKGKEADKVYDNIFKTVKYGKTNISQLAQGFGSTAGVIASSKIKLDEYLASVAAMTTTGQPAAQAHTQLKAAVAGLTRGTKEQQIVFERLGAKNFTDLIQKSGGMVKAFEGIKRVTKGNQAQLIQLVGSIEAYNAIMSLTGAQSKIFKTALLDMREGTNALDEAYAKKLENINSKFQKMSNIVQKISIDYGNALLPAVNVVCASLEKTTGVIDSMSPGVRSAVAIGVTGFGVLLTVVGATSFVIGGTIKNISAMLGAYRALDLYLWAKAPKLTQAFKPINVDLNAIPKNICMAFKSMSGAISNATLSMFAYAQTIPSRATLAFSGAISGLKNGFLNFIPNCKKAILALRTMNLTMSLNPVGAVVAAIAIGAFVIMKYWKPIKALFTGVFKGLKEGLKPLSPLFNSVGNAVKPIVTWFNKLLSPINTAGKASESFGFKVGKAIGGAVTWCVNLIGKFKDIITLGGRIKIGGAGNTSTGSLPKSKVDGSHSTGLSSVPFNGYVAELHKDEAVLTAGENKQWKNIKKGNSGSVSITYAPSVHIASGSAEDEAKFLRMLKKHKQELLALLESVLARREARAYG